MKKANVKLTSGVMPYAYDKMKDFHMGSLSSGFLAEAAEILSRNAVQGKDAAHHAREALKSDAANTNSGLQQRIGQEYVFLQRRRRKSWSYVLLPVWTINI